VGRICITLHTASVVHIRKDTLEQYEWALAGAATLHAVARPRDCESFQPRPSALPLHGSVQHWPRENGETITMTITAKITMVYYICEWHDFSGNQQSTSKMWDVLSFSPLTFHNPFSFPSPSFAFHSPPLLPPLSSNPARDMEKHFSNSVIGVTPAILLTKICMGHLAYGGMRETLKIQKWPRKLRDCWQRPKMSDLASNFTARSIASHSYLQCTRDKYKLFEYNACHTVTNTEQLRCLTDMNFSTTRSYWSFWYVEKVKNVRWEYSH